MANPVWTETALKELAALGPFGARAADQIRYMKEQMEGLRKAAEKAMAKRAMAERQVRDLDAVVHRLNQEIARLSSQ